MWRGEKREVCNKWHWLQVLAQRGYFSSDIAVTTIFISFHTSFFFPASAAVESISIHLSVTYLDNNSSKIMIMAAGRAARAARAGQLTNCLIKTPVCFCPGWGGCYGQRIVFICLCCRRTWHLTTPSSEWLELGTLLHCYIKVSRWPRKSSQLLLLGPFLLFESSYSKDP